MECEGRLRWFVATRIADLIKSAFDECLALIAEVVINRGHCLDHAGSWTGEGEFAVFHFALVERKCAVAKDDETAIGEFTGFVFVEIEDDFFICKGIFNDFHVLEVFDDGVVRSSFTLDWAI